jgi:hypothetical protein
VVMSGKREEVGREEKMGVGRRAGVPSFPGLAPG